MHVLGRYVSSNPDDQLLAIDQRSRLQHTHVIGQTGTGKSTFARQSFLQDVYAGFGGCFFDFHGEDAPWLLEHIPTDRIQDVIYFNPLDRSHAIGYNVLDGIAPEDHATFTDEIVASLRHIHHASWGARMDDILTNAIRPLFDLPGESQGTLLGVVRMLNDPSYRNFVVKQAKDHSVRDFWQREFAEWGKTDKAHNVNSSLNKIRRFQSSPILRHILGQQRSRIDIGRAIAGGQLLIFDINKWRMGAVNANTLASLLVSRIIYEATRRAMPTVEGRGVESAVIPFGVVIDEFQSVTTHSAIEALTGIRKYRVSFTLCHQYTGQLSREVLDAVNGNVGNKVVFRVGGEDALRMQRVMDVASVADLTEQYDFNFIAQIKSGAQVILRKGYVEPLDYQRYGHGAAIRSLMQAKFARPIDEIEAQYERWQCTRHYGKPLVPPKRAAPRSRPDVRRHQGMRTLGQIMLN